MGIWILVAVGLWLVAMGTMGICAGLVKETDRAQRDVLARARREPFLAPKRPRISTPSRATRAHVARRVVGGSRTYVGG
ncbi:MAG TPA: hypothetical protein VGN59_17125 [Acidimicrobiia bacterium]|jgi:hypothetical protein